MKTNLQHELDRQFNKRQRISDDKYAEYEAMFDPMQTDRQARRKRKAKPVHIAKKSAEEILAEQAEDISSIEAGFEITYKPARYEAVWLLDSLRGFFDLGLLSDVLAQVKGGKEASVYRCRASEAFVEANNLKTDLIAAKVYRPRQFRNLRNDATYKQGRAILKENGSAAKKTDHRLMRAVGKKTAFGAQVSHTSWLMYEFTTLEELYAAGAAVPQGFAAGENAILMSYVGDEHRAAPTLNEVTLTPQEALPLFREVLRNIDLLLQSGWIHGDLSAYNILYWNGAVTLIDFPQVTDSRANSEAYNILRRDVQRVCDYFGDYGVRVSPGAITHELWSRYAAIDPNDKAADISRLVEE